MSKAIDFFCTRCRRHLQFAEKHVGAIVSCPYCQQALIVPKILLSEDGTPLENSGSSPYGVDDLLDSGHRLESGDTAEIDLSRSVRGKTIDDEEFLQRLKETPIVPVTPSTPPPLPGETVQSPQVLQGLPPVLEEESIPYLETEGSDLSPKKHRSFFIFGTIITGILLVGILVALFIHDGNKRSAPTPESTKVTLEPVAIDGRVIYLDQQGKVQGDDGSLIFLIPENAPDNDPLTLGSLAPNRPKPVDYTQIVAKLKKRGYFILEADSSGRFDVILPQPGIYWMLIISAHVFQTEDHETKQGDLKKVGLYLYEPGRQLLADYQFVWEKKSLDKNNYMIEHNFRK